MLKNALQNINIQERALNVAALRQDVLANNIANVETPNYKRKDVVFEDILNEHIESYNFEMARTDDKHFAIGMSDGYIVTSPNSMEMRLDGNNVNPDFEMAELAKNQIKYNAMTNAVSSQLRRLNSAIKGGR